MAGDWLKVRKDLHDDPKAIGMARQLGADIDAVCYKLVRVWGWADTHTVDGNAPIVTADWLDVHARCAGFADAMRKVGWLVIRDDGLTFPHFAEHNGKTAKQRALTAERVAGHRGNKRNAATVTEALPEKRREEKKKDPPNPHPGEGGDGFAEFWAAYPRKTARAKAVTAWKRLAPDAALRQRILEAIRRQHDSPQWQRGVYPHAATWLNGRRWEDEVTPRAGGRSPEDIAREQEARREASRRDEERARREGGLATLSQALRGLPGLNGATEGPAGGKDAERADPPGPPGARGPGVDAEG